MPNRNAGRSASAMLSHDPMHICAFDSTHSGYLDSAA